MKLLILLLALCCAVLLPGCSSISHKPQPGTGGGAQGASFIAIFFDGTHNDEASDTNVKKLHSLVALQDRPDIASLYIEGVGTGSDATGAATGAGINRRVQMAYEFILNHYRYKQAATDEPSRIYIFGFSRGAYAARILTSMLYHAGLPPPGRRPDCQLTTAELAEAIHEAFAPQSAHVDPIYEPGRRTYARMRLEAFHKSNSGSRLLTRGCFPEAPRQENVTVEVLGLWDTVEAMGFANWPSRIAHKLGIAQHRENIDARNIRYGDKLCNVRHAFHAVSIDDNRAWIFTPLLLTRRHMFDGCAAADMEGKDSPPANPMLQDGKIIKGRLQEVWFSGAHADVGGGYGDSALSGVSLNWMIERLNDVAEHDPNKGILPPGARVREDVFGTSHDPSTGFFDLTYHFIHRDLVRYMDKALDEGTPGIPNREAEGWPASSPADIFKGRLCVHPSVFKRRRSIPLQPFENAQLSLKRAGVVALGVGPIDPPLRWCRYVEPTMPVVPPTGVMIQVDKYPKCAGIEFAGEEAP